jgi:putative ABC transport system ATP-binding protein
MRDSAPKVILQASRVHKTYLLGRTPVAALRGVDLKVTDGELAVVAGPSGSGKTTLLNLLGLLDTPDSGEILFEGQDVARQSEAQRTLLRRRHLGFVFQSFNLVPVLSAYENVEYPLWIDGVSPPERKRRVLEALESVGLAGRAHHRPDELSGGERQRVSLARALVHDPKVVLADEPTASIDTKTGQAIMDLFLRLNAERGTTFLLSSHDPQIVARAARTIRLTDGLVVEDVHYASLAHP